MKGCLPFIILFLLPVTVIHAQENSEKFDVVVKTNGEEMVGKVTEITDTEVKFNYKGESLTYTIKKPDISRITFASGRVQIFNEQKVTNENQSTESGVSKNAADSRNKVAILPVSLIVDNNSGPEEMSEKIQLECYNTLSKKAVNMTFQDPATTNAILIRNKITKETIKGYTMDELANLLGVEYVVQAIVTVNRTSAVASTYSNTNSTNTSSNSSSKNNFWKDVTKSSSSSSSSITQNYKTNIIMNVFDDTGKKRFGQSHDSFWQSQDAYKATLEYLAKRTPVYAK